VKESPLKKKLNFFFRTT